MKTVNVGIDLGTTYSAVAEFSSASGQVEILKNDIGEEMTPSVVYMENGEVLIGQEAKDQQASGNLNTAAFYKSMMGDKNFVRSFDGKQYDAEALSSVFLKQLKIAVEQRNDVKIAGAVITVPAYFNEAQRQATIHAGEKAGLKVLKIINEPTAAIIAYGLTGGGRKTAMVYDLGGGTFDVTIAKIDGPNVDVIATNGDHQLGGRNWDKVLVDEIAERFRDEYSVDIAANKEDYTELIVKCERAKKQLTSMAATTVTVRSEGFCGHYTVTREEFEESTRRLLVQTIMLTESCFNEIGGDFSWNSLDEIVLVGGSTRMPQVANIITQKFGKAPQIIGNRVDTIVAAGAAMQAHLCVAGSITLIPSKIDMGAARFTGGAPNANYSLTINSDSIKDVTSHSLGMLAFSQNGEDIINSIIIKKNSTVGVPYGKRYSFKGDKLEVYVLQGETSNPYDCTLLYKYIVEGLIKHQDNKFTINFLYDQNGVVDVTGKLNSGASLFVRKSTVTEDVHDLITRLLKEKKEAEQRARIEVAFAIDTSGSMSGAPLEEAKKSINQFVNQIGDGIPVSIISFDDVCKLHCKHETNSSRIFSATKNIDIGGGTSADPIEFYERSLPQIEPNRIFIVLTDGEWFHQDVAIKSAENAKRNGVQIYAVGFGSADYSFLQKIASPDGAKKIDLNKLVETFGEIAGVIATESSNGFSIIG